MCQGLRQDGQDGLALLRRKHVAGRRTAALKIGSGSGEPAGRGRIHSAPPGRHRRQPDHVALLAGPRSRSEFAGQRTPFRRPLGDRLRRIGSARRRPRFRSGGFRRGHPRRLPGPLRGPNVRIQQENFDVDGRKWIGREVHGSVGPQETHQPWRARRRDR